MLVTFVVFLGFHARLPPLRDDAGQKKRVAEQVAAPQPAGLDEEPGEPLEAVVGEEAWTPPEPSRGIVEDGPAREGHPEVELAPVLHQPTLLQGHAETEDEHVGPR